MGEVSGSAQGFGRRRGVEVADGAGWSGRRPGVDGRRGIVAEVGGREREED